MFRSKVSGSSHLESGGDPVSNPVSKKDDDDGSYISSNPELIRLELAKKPYKVPRLLTHDLTVLGLIVVVVILIYIFR